MLLYVSDSAFITALLGLRESDVITSLRIEFSYLISVLTSYLQPVVSFSNFLVLTLTPVGNSSSHMY